MHTSFNNHGTDNTPLLQQHIAMLHGNKITKKTTRNNVTQLTWIAALVAVSLSRRAPFPESSESSPELQPLSSPTCPKLRVRVRAESWPSEDSCPVKAWPSSMHGSNTLRLKPTTQHSRMKFPPHGTPNPPLPSIESMLQHLRSPSRRNTATYPDSRVAPTKVRDEIK